ncbi:hypothetical protein ACVWYF_003914 [Hymenobacter sp. UYAg731]
MSRLPLLLLVLLAFASCQPEARYTSAAARYHTGDNRRWAARSYDDSHWAAERCPTGHQVFWVRSWVTVRPGDYAPPLGLEIRAFGAFAVYWDGILIGSNGQPATGTQPEVPGTETSHYLIPDSLAQPGRHLVARRGTQWAFSDEPRLTQLTLHSYPHMLRAPLLRMAFLNLIAGALLVAAIYYLLLFINSRQRQSGSLVFGLICLLCFLLLMAEYAKYYLDIPYPDFYLRLQLIGLLTFAIALLVPLYFTIQFGFKSQGPMAGVLLAVLAGLCVVNYPHYDRTALLLSRAMWGASLLVVLAASRRQVPGSRLALAGLVASAVVSSFLWYDSSLFIGFAIVVLCMLCLHTIRVREMENERRAAQLLSSRLKLELLKKNIQPHFIKNTLTSLLDWIEESPPQGAVFIQALAKEFDLLNDIVDSTLIPVSKELELCQNHLQIMQFRKEIRYTLEHSGLDPAELVPPAIFHTILENGITHSLPPANGHIRFQLRFERCRRYKKYQLLTCAPHRPEVQGATVGTGTGFQYIVARLQETYGSGWEFHSAAVPEGWLTSITITQGP